MDSIQAMASRKALVLETEGLVAERVRRMLAEEGVTTCLVDEVSLFHELRKSLVFDVYVVGVSTAGEIEALGTQGLAPLILLAHLEHGELSTHYRVALPEAVLVDRSLLDPDALKAALRGDRPEVQTVAEAGVVRRAFQPFNLSERQLEVLSRALLGDSSVEIANKLYISDLTVRNHLHAIYERVGVSGRRELLGRFVRGLMQEGHA
jgi:DNA-binding CsgD family transcriptional regulator